MTMFQKIDPQGCGCDAPEQLSKLISIDSALARITQHAAPVVGTETLPITQARGRVLATPVLARAMVPPFDNAAMDGYAVATGNLTGDGPWHFPVAARVPAGWSEATPIGSDGVARIFTGAPVPPGTDAVIRQEDAQRDGDMVTFAKRPEPGLNIRRAGSDMCSGQVILDAGARLGPREIAACAAAGAGRVALRRTLRVALLVTGDEVRGAGSARQRAEIWDVNTPMLCAAMGQADVEMVEVAQVADTRAALEGALAGQMGWVDLIVTTGGVSVGEEDHVKPSLAALGGTLHFSGVGIKPGKPVSYGALGGTHWLGLPGNPLAALLTWQVFGTALVQRLTGQRASGLPRRHVVIENAIHRKPGRCELRPATILGFDAQGREIAGFDSATHSGRVGNLPKADGVLLLPAESDHLPEGALVEFLPFYDI